MNANQLLKHNIDALLKARRRKRKDLARWCGCSEAWISKIFRYVDREIPLKYLDRIADFFELTPYQLFHPGLSPVTDRRSGRGRRSGKDRRVAHAPVGDTRSVIELSPNERAIVNFLRKQNPETG